MRYKKMAPTSITTWLRIRGSYYFWVLVFFLFIFGIASFLYYATVKVDYVWRWYRIPQYFYYHGKVEILSEIEGKITKIIQKNGQAVVFIQEEGQVKQYTVPFKSLQVSEGDLIYPGDVLSSHEALRPGILLLGLWLTLKVSMIAISIGIIMGIITGLCRISSNPALKWTAITYIELVRGSPLLVQIFIWYFVLGTVLNAMFSRAGLPQIPPLWYGVASLAFFVGAYVAEIVRAGIQSIHRGQMEAARSLGMTYANAMQHVILPQALRRILPPLAGQFISLIKDSSLLGIIAIRELTKATREVVTTSLQPYELWFVCALLYLILTFSLSMFVQYLERRIIIS